MRWWSENDAGPPSPPSRAVPRRSSNAPVAPLIISPGLLVHSFPLGRGPGRHVATPVQSHDEALSAVVFSRASVLVLVVPYLDRAAPRAAEERSEVADRGGDTELGYQPDGDSRSQAWLVAAPVYRNHTSLVHWIQARLVA